MRVRKSGHQKSFGVSLDRSSYMVEMQMRQKNICNIWDTETQCIEILLQTILPVEVVVAEEFFALLVADSCIHQDQSVSLLNKQRAHGPATHISFIGWIRAAPKALGHHSEHSASIQFEITCV